MNRRHHYLFACLKIVNMMPQEFSCCNRQLKLAFTTVNAKPFVCCFNFLAFVCCAIEYNVSENEPLASVSF